MSYVNSPACELVETNCCCCGRPLVDAVSVETGVGPDCRAKYGYGEAQAEPDFSAARSVSAYWHHVNPASAERDAFASLSEAIEAGDARRAANILTHYAAQVQGTARALGAARVIALLGFRNLASKIANNAGAIRTWYDVHGELGETIAVRAPYCAEFATALKAAGAWRRFDKNGSDSVSESKKTWHVRACDRSKLWAALCKAYPGSAVAGPNGIATTPA